MELKLFATVFASVFAAEIADKTQLATLLFAADSPQNKMTVFLGSAMALVLSSAVAVVAGSALSQWVNPRVLSWIAGLAFIAIGIWTIAK
jgi:putative Ca2+/H+ antiporter (TMEM165/GDT1 family)